jgi:hypothetical protein
MDLQSAIPVEGRARMALGGAFEPEYLVRHVDVPSFVEP